MITYCSRQTKLLYTFFTGSYVATGNTGKDTVDSAPLEMKILTTQLDVQPQHLDTKVTKRLHNNYNSADSLHK